MIRKLEMEFLEKELTKTSEKQFVADYTIVFGDLIEQGLDWGRDEYYLTWEITSARRIKLNSLIESSYYFRELGELPFAKWKHNFVNTLNLILPKYDMLLDILDSKLDLLQSKNSIYKERILNSDFPQSQLQGSSDYASDSKDTERVEEEYSDVLDKILKIYNEYEDVYKKIINEIGIHFISIMNSIY